jgi:adenylate cyclase
MAPSQRVRKGEIVIRQRPYSSYELASSSAQQSPSAWRTYFGITSLLLVIVVALAGGIIWYNSKKSNELAIAAAERMIEEVGDDVVSHAKLLYDPIYAVIRIGSRVPELTSPTVSEDPRARSLILRELRSYPQLLSIYVGFDNGDFFMVTHIAGENSTAVRDALHAPQEAVFANEIITADAGGDRKTRWVYLAENGDVIGRADPVPTEFDPRQRPWYDAAKHSETVELSNLYRFATSGEPGFTVSRSFGRETPGVIGADLAVTDLARFLREQRITPASAAYIFTKKGEVIASSGPAPITKEKRQVGQTSVTLPRVADLGDPVITRLAASYEDGRMSGSRVFDVGDRAYIGRVIEIPPHFGRDQLLALIVPIDEIEKPVTEIRNQTLLYSVAFLVFALPLYMTLVIAWIDRRLKGRFQWPGSGDDI